MCGFVGLFRFCGNAIRDEDARRISIARERMSHRGPDDCGEIRSGKSFVAGFNRLAVVAPECGKQPFCSEDRRFAAVFNGEIYNYRALAEELKIPPNSEISVIVELFRRFGVEAFPRLRGMFAIALFDSEREELVCARDRFGVKPFFYSLRERDEFSFASEIKGLPFRGCDSPEISEKALSAYAAFQFVPEPETAYENVFALRGGHVLVVSSDGSFREFPFEEKTLSSASSAFPYRERKRGVRRAVEESVRMCLQSDAEVGTFLSGGVDSSIIAAVASKINPGIKAFTVHFECRNYPNEIDVCRRTAEFLHIDLIERKISAEDYVRAFEPMIRAMDSPFADPSAVGVYLLAKLASEHVKSALSGEGADELFGGYKPYMTTAWTRRFGRAQGVADSVLHIFGKTLPKNSLLRKKIRERCFPLAGHFFGPTALMRGKEVAYFFRESFPRDVPAEKIRAALRLGASLTRLQKMQRCDWELWLVGDILAKADRLSMANSLEVRVPFLDEAVYCAASALPDEDKVSLTETKRILRDAFSDLLPNEVVRRPKLGFPSPVASWLKDELFDWARAYLSGEIAKRFLKTENALRHLERYRKGELDSHHYRYIYQLVALAAWLDRRCV